MLAEPLQVLSLASRTLHTGNGTDSYVTAFEVMKFPAYMLYEALCSLSTNVFQLEQVSHGIHRHKSYEAQARISNKMG